MATSGALADFGRLPTSRKVLLFVVIGTMIGLIYWRFVYKSLAKERDKVAQVHRQNAKKLADLEANLKTFKELLKNKDKLDEQFRRYRAALPTDAEAPAFFETIEGKLSAAGIQEMKFAEKPQEPFGEFIKVPLEVQITGTFLQIKKFFASLVEKKPVKGKEPELERIISIEDLALGQAKLRNREIVMTAKFTAVTFRQQEAPAAAPLAPGQLPANAPAPAAASGPPATTPAAPPPMPSTPAEIKQHVQDTVNERPGKIDDATRDPAKGSDRLKGGL